MFFTRFVSLIAAIVVFVTTYALVLPAITLEKTASCGLDEHQHSDECYEYVLTCGQEESEGHHHDDSCYTVTRELECQLEEHQHSPEDGCYDEEGNLICQLEEHTHDDDCYSEVKELTCGREESEGHHHSDTCYEKVLVCGKEAHTHSKDCYVDDGEADGSNEEAADQASSVPMPDEAAGEQATEAAAEESLSDNYVPELDPLNMEAVLGKKTGFYYFHAEEGQEMPSNSAEITDWQKVEEDTELASTDLVKVYLPYAIPAGSLNETNPTARYRLPENIHLTDEQIDVINENENGIAAGYVESDPEYQKYLGAEAIEGNRTPDEILQDDAQEYISAVVKAENVYDVEGIYGEKGAYLGQDLIFTFVPYTIEKNQITYDAEQNVVLAGEKITGWFACDFRLDQIDWGEKEAEERIEEEPEEETQEDSDQGIGDTVVNVVEKTAEILFVSEDKDKDIKEIKRTLKLVEPVEDTVSEEKETPEFQSGTLTADGDGYKIILDYTEEAMIPENASLSVREITAETDKEAYEACLAQAQQHVDESGEQKSTVDSNASRFFDIEIQVTNEDGTTQKIEPAAPVSVNIQITDTTEGTSDTEPGSKEAQNSDPTVLHFAEDGVEQIEATSESIPAESGNEAAADDSNTAEVRFEAESFSIYGVVYTVDFHTEIGSETYDFSIGGGGYALISELVNVLGLASDDPNTEEDELRLFVEQITNVTFTAPELVNVSKAEKNTTIGDIKKALSLECEYTAELTQEEIDAINEAEVAAGDWALISLHPFDTRETLTVTMEDGTIYEITVTDSRIVKTVLSQSGKTWEITVTYDETAGIPDGAELYVREILPEDEEYDYSEYYEEAARIAGDEAIEQGIEMPLIADAHLFDIEIRDANGKIEPDAPVLVSIRLLDAAEADTASVVHFAEGAAELMKLEEKDSKDDTGELVFETGSFSVYTVVNVTDFSSVAGNGPYALVSGVYKDPGPTTGWSEDWGKDYFTIIVNSMSVTDQVRNNNSLRAMGVHSYTENGTDYVGGDATEWGFEADGNGYRIYTLKNNVKNYIRRTNNGNDIGLTTNANQATTFTIVPNSDGTVYIKNGNYYLCNRGSSGGTEWNDTYFQMNNPGTNSPGENNERYKFTLCKKAENFHSFAAQKVAVSSLVPDDTFLIYRKFVDASGGEILYALAHDGSLVRIYDGGDFVYWRETDKNVEWNYQYAEDGYHIWTHAPGSEDKIYINPVYSDGGQVFSSENVGLTLLGRDNSTYASALELWDQPAYDYAGLHVVIDAVTGAATLEAGKRTSGSSDQFLFAVTRSMPGTTAQTVDTVDSEALGIHITMFDYGSASTEYAAGAKLHEMSTVIDGYGQGSHNYVEGFHPHNATTLVRNYLQNGVPVSDVGNAAGRAMTGLFTENGSAVTNSVTGVTNLFLKSYYDENGMFRYRSEDNYAYLAPDSTEFKVYRQAATPYTTDMSVGRSYYFHGHFMPFNDIDTNNHLSRLMNQYGNAYVDGEIVGELPVGDGRTYEDIYGVKGTPNYFTGMKMEANFSQPKNGTMANGDEMIFKFTGDDDMWVYIDDILVLDVGGIHEPLSGTINFKTGVVTNPPGSSLPATTTLKAIFDAALVDPNVPNDVKAKIRKIEWNGNTFASYTNHTFSSFYMERGAGASNLDIQFNLKVALTKQFSVLKEVPDEIDPRFDNHDYHFRATFMDGNEVKPLYPGVNADNYDDVCASVVYKGRKDDNGDPVPVPIDEYGCFVLHAGEEAVFMMADESIPYTVSEVDIDSNLVEIIKVNDEQATPVNGEVTPAYHSTQDRGELHYLNSPKTQNLLITKHITEDSADWESDNPTFEFRVYLESTVEEKKEVVVDDTVEPPVTETQTVTSRKLIPYAYGPYYVTKEEDGETHYYTMDGTNNRPVDRGTEPVVCAHAGRSGSISRIPPEYTVVIPKLTVGTNFYLEERRDIIPEGYEFVREELRDGTFDLTDMGTSEEAIERTLARDESEPGQDFDPSTVGAIKSGVDAESHVYNRKLKEDIPITVEKEWSGIDGSDPALKDASVTVVVGRYILQEKAGNFQIKKTLNVVGDSVDPSDIDFVAKYYIEGTDSSGASRSFGPYWVYSVDSEGGVATVSGTLPPGTYTVREEIVKADGAYIWTNSGSPASLVITDGEDGDPTPVNFSATATVRTGSLKITSTLDDGGSSVSLDGVTYTVLDANGELAKKTDGTPVGAIPYSDLPIVIENLKVGSYTVVENDPPETPENFVLSEKTPLTDRIPVQVTEGSDPVEANFSRVYAPDVVSNTFTVHKFTNGNWAYDYYPNNGQPQNAPLDESGTFSWRPGEPVDFVLYLDNATWNRFNGTQGRDWTATYNGENISLISAQPISSEGVYAYTFRIPEVRADGVLQLGCNAQRNAWRDSKPYELKEVSRSLSMSRSTRKLLSGSPLRDGAKGRDTISPSDYGTAPETDADSLMKYVDDTSYNEEIVLNQGNGWTQILTDRPVQETVDGVSYTYYYYIKSVVETGMPQGTTCSVALNGTEKLLISETNNTTESLSVTNTVPRGSLQITKTARKNDAAGSGTFWYAVYAEEYDPYAATHPAPVSSGSITVGADGTGTDTVSDLLYGTYYVYELDGENGTPIVSNGGSVWHSIGGTVYRVTGSGTTATVQSGTTPTAALQNETFTVDVSVKKIWVTPANMTAPESIVMRLSNNQEVTLTAPSWQGTISNLPKYDHNGDLIEYSWTEGSMPAGYVLTDQSEADGTTTFTNSYTDSYRPVMEIKGVKVWDDEGDEHRPGSIIVKLYKDGVLYATQTVTAPVEDLDADQWPFRFTNLPIFNDDGTLAQYTIKEELPAGYSGDYKITQEFSTASYEMGDIQGEIVNSGQGSQTFKVSEGVDLGYIVIRHGNDFIIWTPRPATADEISSIKTKVVALSEQFNGINTASGNSLKIISGVPKTIDVGNKHAVSVYMQDGEVWIKFLNPNAWSDFAYGKIPYTYTQVGGEGGGTITNTKKITEVRGSKTWVDGGRTHDNAAELTLTLKRTIKPVTEESEWETINNIEEIPGASFAWHNNTYVYSGLPRFQNVNDTATEYVYKVEESAVNVTEGTGTDQVTIAYSQQTEGNDFTNTELVNLQAEKVWKIGEDDITTIIRNASVTLKLQQKIGEGEWEDVELTGLTNQQTLSVGNTADANAWKAVWNGLPKYARVEENDVLIQYRVVETEAKLSAITLTTAEPVGIENGSAVVENTLPETGITVTKQWKDGTTPAGGNDKVFDEVREINFTLYQKLDEGEPAVYTEYGENGVGTVAYTPQPGSWSTEEIAGLPCYVYNESTHTWSQATYSVVETAPEGVNVTYSQGGTPSSSAAYVGADSTEDERTITIINTDILLTLNISKVNAVDNSITLSGAEFLLTRIDGNSTTISYIGSPVTPVTNGSNNLTGDDGSAVFSGLSVGYYEIWEKTLPTGFIRSVDDGRFYIRVKDSVITLLEKQDRVAPKDWPERDSEEILTFSYDITNLSASATVGNTPGAALPSTGGPGTRIFTIFGSILIAGAGLLLWRRRRTI